MGKIKEVAQHSYGLTVDVRFPELPGQLNYLGITVASEESVGPILDWIAANRKEIIRLAVIQKKDPMQSPVNKIVSVKSKPKVKAKLEW